MAEWAQRIKRGNHPLKLGKLSGLLSLFFHCKGVAGKRVRNFGALVAKQLGYVDDYTK